MLKITPGWVDQDTAPGAGRNERRRPGPASGSAANKRAKGHPMLRTRLLHTTVAASVLLAGISASIAPVGADSTAPSNDAFGGALALPGGPIGSVITSNRGATVEPSEPTIAGRTTDRSIWYEWTAPIDGTVTLDTAGSIDPDTSEPLDTQLAVYTGWTITSLDCVPGCDNDDAGPATATSHLAVPVTAGTDYHIVVATSAPSIGGDIELHWSIAGTPPANDERSAAMAMTGEVGQLTTGSWFATADPSDPAVGDDEPEATVWFEWIATKAGTLTVDTIGSTDGDNPLDTLLGVYRADEANAVQCLGTCADDDAAGAGASRVSQHAEIGDRFLIQVGNRAVAPATGGGTVTVNWSLASGRDARPTATLAVSSPRSIEGAPAQFVLTRFGGTDEAAAVTYRTASGTAVSGRDFVAVGASIAVFAPGQHEVTIPVATVADDVAERAETFALQLSGPINADLADSSATATISDVASGPATISIDDATVSEGGTTTVNLRRAGDATERVTAKIATADRTATAPGDYAAVPATTVVFEPGQVTAHVQVATTQNLAAVATNLTFKLVISGVTDAVLADGISAVTIVDDDGSAPAPPTSWVALSDAQVIEGGTATVSIVRHGLTGAPLTVTVRNSTSTGVPGSDFTELASTPVAFDAGQTTEQVTLATLEDSVGELDETVNVVLSAPKGVGVENATGVVTIVDDDPGRPEISVDDVATDEAHPATVTLRRRGDLTDAVSVRIVSSAGSATPRADFESLPLTTIEFASGVAERRVQIPVAADAVAESMEYFTVSLSVASGATIADSSARVSVFDAATDPPAYSVEDTSVAEGGTAVVTIRRSGDLSEFGTVTVRSAPSSAVSPGDFAALPATQVVFGAGVETLDVQVDTTDNAVDAPRNLAFTVKLTAPFHGSVSDATATVTIADDEGQAIAAPSAWYTVTDRWTDEGGSSAITVTRRGNLAGAGAVKVQLAGGTATLGADVAPFEPQTIAFPAGVTQQTISVATVDDAFAERPETVLVKLSAATAGTIEDSAGTLTIRDDD